MTLVAYPEGTERLAERYNLPVFSMGDVVLQTINQTLSKKALTAHLQC